MKCPGCNRDNEFTLSICPSCGTMINDSVREELISKVTPLIRPFAKPIPKPENVEPASESPVQNISNSNLFVQIENVELTIKPEIKTEMSKVEAVKENSETNELNIKHTNPTLVEFHNKNAKLPEWRLELQNAVNRRNNKIQANSIKQSAQSNLEVADLSVSRRRSTATSGANALKVDEAPEAEIKNVSNPKLAAALKRIEKSRKQFLESEKPAPLTFENKEKRNNSVLYFTAKPNDHLPKSNFSNNSVSFETKIKTVHSLKTNGDKFDTNKLPPLPKPAKISSSFNQRPVVSEVIETNFVQKVAENQELVEQETIEIPEVIEQIELQEIDDCAPFAMRFNAGLFDLIIGSFASLLLLTPFMAMGGEWFSLAGFLAFLATTSLVMFIYLTTATGIYGRTFGMKLFSLEVVDIEGEEYPTLHQAAVSSSVYLVSLALGGIGFLTLLFNEEKRAAHDLASGTIVVKEF